MRWAFVALFALTFTLGVVTASPDANGDGTVDILDLVVIVNNFGTNNAQYDINSDGNIDLLDLVLVVNSFEPAPSTFCQADIKHCSDGSTVTRDPNNNCNFYSCPSGTSTFGPGANEPNGFTEVFSFDGSTKNLGPLINFYGKAFGDINNPNEAIVCARDASGAKQNRVRVVDDTTDARNTNGKALEMHYCVGDNAGHDALAQIDNWRGSKGDQKAIYIRILHKYSPNFQQHIPSGPGGSKVILIRGGTTNDASSIHWNIEGTDSTNMYLREVSNSAQPQDNPQFRLHPNLPGAGQSTNLNPRGEWNEVELLLYAQSSPGASDGHGRIWINGVEINPFPQWAGGQKSGNLDDQIWQWYGNENPQGFMGLQLGQYWGGSGLTKDVNDWTRWGGYYVSGIT